MSLNRRNNTPIQDMNKGEEYNEAFDAFRF